MCVILQVIYLNILKALRWRLSRPKSYEQKCRYLLSYIKEDIFEVENSYIINLLNNSSNKTITIDNVVLQAVKLINCLSSWNEGRLYILKIPNIINELSNLLINETLETNIFKHLMIVIQRCSLNSKIQKQLLSFKLISWCLDKLNKVVNNSIYITE